MIHYLHIQYYIKYQSYYKHGIRMRPSWQISSTGQSPTLSCAIVVLTIVNTVLTGYSSFSVFSTLPHWFRISTSSCVLHITTLISTGYIIITTGLLHMQLTCCCENNLYLSIFRKNTAVLVWCSEREKEREVGQAGVSKHKDKVENDKIIQTRNIVMYSDKI